MPSLQNPAIRESSGICRSNTRAGVYWTHNDSGNATVLYAFGTDGRNLGAFPLSTRSIDAEDCASAIVRGVPTLILADVGDNKCNRASYKIFVVTEPTNPTPVKLTARTITFSYPDGKHRNCESCALLPDGRVVLVTKSFPTASGASRVFTISSFLSGAGTTTVEAGPTLSSTFKTITSMDILGNRMVLLGVGSGKARAGLFPLLDWTHPTKWVNLPVSAQPEGICFTQDGLSVLLTSEVPSGVKGLTPLHTVSL